MNQCETNKSKLHSIIALNALLWTSLATANEALFKNFSDVYNEETALSNARTVATYSQIRTGWNWHSGFETYLTTRLGADTRTVLEEGSAVYNDNYLFLGVGTDYLSALPGVRLTFQFGYSLDLTAKQALGGIDGRTGLITYHEFKILDSRKLHSEIYSETLYVKRYQNILSSIQIRILYDWIRFNSGNPEKGLKIEPLINLVVAFDLDGYDYNRFLESRFGFRFGYRGPIDIALLPYYAIGGRIQMPTDYPFYQDFRTLLVLSKNL
jgi:hypothetical protein